MDVMANLTCNTPESISPYQGASIDRVPVNRRMAFAARAGSFKIGGAVFVKTSVYFVIV
jgi:hypothetical protein